MNPVPVPQPVQGQDARQLAYDRGKALEKANKRLVNSRKWYGDVRTEYAKEVLP